MKAKKIKIISFTLIILMISVLIYFIFNEKKFLTSKETISPIVETNKTPIETSQPETVNSNVLPPSDTDPILEQLNALTLEEKIGQLFILGFNEPQYEKDDLLKQWMTSYHIGNFIVFKRNIKSNEQLKTLISSIDTHNPKQNIPIWIGIDQEGGIVNRLPESYPSAQQFAKWGDSTLTYESQSKMAEELVQLGIDLNFAPVLDINSNPNNPVINTRAFGNDAQTVITHTSATIQAYEDHELVAVGKHFPGHGDTQDDSHHSLPIVKKSWDELKKLELKPFEYAISIKIPAIMVGHLLIQEVDNSYPASLSKAVITEKLVNEMKFDGLIITDDMVMQGVLKQHDIGEASILALEAGVHMLIIGHDKDKQYKAINAVTEAVKSGRIDESMLNEKVYKILSYKQATQ